MKKVLSFLGICSILLLPQLASAAEFNAAEKLRFSPSDPFTENAYIAASMVDIASEAFGDVFAVGSLVDIRGDIANDAFIAGSSVTIENTIGDDIRAAGSLVRLESTVNGETMLAGSVVTIGNQAILEGKSYLAGAQVDFFGTSNSDVQIAGEVVHIDGVINGNLTIYAGEVEFGENAIVMGNVYYEAENEAVIAASAQLANIEFNPTEFERNVHKPMKGLFAGYFTVFALIKLLTLAITTVVLVILFGHFFKDATKIGKEKFGRQFFHGLVMVIVIPIVLLVAFGTIIGSGLATAAGLLFGLIWFIGRIVGAVILGSLFWGLFQQGKKKVHNVDWRVALIGAIIMFILGMIPIIGWLAKAVFVLVGIGTVGYIFKQNIWDKR